MNRDSGRMKTEMDNIHNKAEIFKMYVYVTDVFMKVTRSYGAVW